MLSFLPGFIRGILAITILISNLLFWFIPLLPFVIIKLTLPFKAVRKITDFVLNFLCTTWARGNGLFLMLINDIQWDIEGDDDLNMSDWYLVVANHQSWSDIVVLQYVLNNRIPYFRFFLKQELIWLPIFNLVWAALDYPYMKRYSKQFLKKHPHLKGKDIETTKKSCEKFKDIPVSIMNFVEGTRFTEEKHKKQKSSYQYLLNPKAGGIAFVLMAMGQQLTSILDVTIKYDPKAMGFWQFLCGRVKKVTVRIEKVQITEDLLGDYVNDSHYKIHFRQWVNQLWEKKDRLLAALHSPDRQISEPTEFN